MSIISKTLYFCREQFYNVSNIFLIFGKISFIFKCGAYRNNVDSIFHTKITKTVFRSNY